MVINMKIHYQKETGIVCERYPKDVPITDDCLEMEITDDKYQQTLQCDYGRIWAVKDDSLVVIDDEEIINSTEYKKYLLNAQLMQYKSYLSDTDYVISKLNELKLEDEDEYETEKANYADVLVKRKEARKKINELEEELEKLK